MQKKVDLVKLCAIIILFVLCQNKITPVTDNTISDICSNAFEWKLNLCNISCTSCSSSNINACTSCNNQLVLSGTKCLVSNATDNYHYESFLTDTKISSQQINQFTIVQNNQILSARDVVHICGTDYKFDMAGLFSFDQTIGIQFAYKEIISNVRVKFNFISLLDNITLYIDVGDNSYSNSLSSISSLNANYTQSNTGNQSSQGSFLYIPILNVNNVRQIIQVVSTNMFDISTNQISVKISCNGVSKQKNIWGFSDLIFIAKQCNTCVKTPIQSLTSTLSLWIGYVALAVFVMLLILFLFLSYQNFMRKKKILNKLGATKSNNELPLKSIDKILSQTHAATKLKQKEIDRIAQSSYGKMRAKNSLGLTIRGTKQHLE